MEAGRGVSSSLRPAWPLPEETEVRLRDDALRMQSHEQLARHGVSTAELLGSVDAHVPARDRGGEVQELIEVLAQRHTTANVDERERRGIVVDDDRCTRIAPK